jgi:hypothetical protein
MRNIVAALAITVTALALSAGVAHADPQCYQKLLYRICMGDDGQWHVEPIPALPIPGQPPAPPPAPGGPQ